MLVKASIAVAALISAAVSASSVDFRDLYNGMYPVNGLKRDVLGLCHASQPTFIRAIRSDRVNCYDSMPDAIDIAIGWVRTTDRLASMKAPSAIEMAERLLIASTLPGRPGLVGARRYTGYLAVPEAVRPCEPTALAGSSEAPLAASDNRLARRLISGNDPTLAALGLTPHAAPAHADPKAALPILPLDGAAAPLGDPVLSDGDELPNLAPRLAATDCKTPI